MTARFCLACGHRLAMVREGGRRRGRCRRCGWTFYGNPVPAAVALVVRGARVLLVLRARPPHAGTWDLPGGFLEEGELPRTCLERELREELGLRVRRAHLLGFVTDRYGPRGFPVLTAIFRVSPVTAPLCPADDVAAAQWFPRTAVPFRSIAFPAMRRFLRRYLSGRRSWGPGCSQPLGGSA